MRLTKHAAITAVLLFGVAAASAAAATWTVVIGTNGNDTINLSAKVGNYRVYGLAGQDNLYGSQGDNYLVGDGHCPQGEQGDNMSATATGNQGDDAYCDSGEVKGDRGDTFHGGSGNNVMIGGGGPNVMYGAGSHNAFYAGSVKSGTTAGTGNLIYGGQNGDAIYARQGTSTIYPGKGPNVTNTRNGNRDYVICSGSQDTVYADQYDVVKHCAHVSVSSYGRDHRARKRVASKKGHRHKRK